MPQLFSALRVLGRRTVMKSALTGRTTSLLERVWLRATMRESGADFPVAGRCDAQLGQRQRRPRAVGMPATQWRGRKRRQGRESVTHVERVVSPDEIHRGAHGRTDAAAFDHDIMFEPPHQPDAWRFLNHDETQAMPGWRRRSFGVQRRRAIVCMRQAGGLHA